MYLLDQTFHRKPEFVHEIENITACPSIKVPYPPPISARELIFHKKNGEVPALLSTSQNEQVSLGKSQPYDAQTSTVQTTDRFMSMDEYPTQPAKLNEFLNEFDTWLDNIIWNNFPISDSNPIYVDSSPFTDNKGSEEEIGLSYTTNIRTSPFMNLTPSEMTVNHAILPFRQ
ncbi:11667_t:CDS:2 [Dentiscutata heterogama]|uniref:11667_t:CDS:1 n=1 Tax=Dentiscutata heterogama TaxID=1316150 RepID=A0ACA9KAX2_9GLOM|nr:11667_t:CDS:2 [Dentiscutata heterogama]